MVKLAHVGPTASAFYRNFFGGVILLVVVMARREPIRRDVRPYLLAAACGLFFAVDLALWHKSIIYIGPGLSTILANFEVFFLAIWGLVFMGERFTWRIATAAPLGIFGLLLLVGFDWGRLGPTYQTGVISGLSSAVLYTGFILTLQRSQGRPDSLSARVNMTVVCLSAALFTLPIVFGMGESLRIPDAASWSALIAYGLLSQVIGWLLISTALPYVEASKAGLLLLLQPTLSFVWDVLLFGRSASAMDILGVCLTLAAIYLGSAGPRPVKRQK